MLNKMNHIPLYRQLENVPLNQTAGYLPLLVRSYFPTSTSRGFCLIRYSILIGCFIKTFC